MIRVARGVAALVAALVVALSAGAAHADGEQCRVVEIELTPLAHAGAPMSTPLQIVAWIEDAAGTYQDTVFITQQTGTFGLGNRPGRFDFNSGPMWPYGRRITVFPVWAHRHPFQFQELEFQDGADSNLSHLLRHSSRERHYCQPLLRDQPDWELADAGTCASTVYTDKGKLSSRPSRYPPRADLMRSVEDDPSVEMLASLNPFDAVSGATPRSGSPATLSWSIPPSLTPGPYVLWIETSREFDHNATYSEASYPAPPDISFSTWGEPYRGQPSTVYKVPFTIGATETVATTSSYAGYGAPDGADGTLRPPDATITTGVPGSGAQRLAVQPDGHVIKVTARPEPDVVAPAAPASPKLVAATSKSATVSFLAPGDDGLVGKVRGYEVRIQSGVDITEATFESASLVAIGDVPIAGPGTEQRIELTGLLFETEYSVAIRAFDDCRNKGPISTLRFATTARTSGEVDACFVATAAYGSLLANDVEMLRHFRDALLRRTVLGELAVQAYYTFGPAVAGAVGESELLRETARAVLDPLVRAVASLRL